MVPQDSREERTLYSLLQIHAAAPLDLVSAAYWRLAAQAHAARLTDELAERQLADLTHAYRVLADPTRRHDYDVSVGLEAQSVAPRIHGGKRRSLLSRVRRNTPVSDPHVDYYELLRVDPAASASIIHEAYPIIRGYYLRLVRVGEEPAELLDLLEEAYAVTSDPVRRARYEQERSGGDAVTHQPMQRPDVPTGQPSAHR